MAKFQPLLEVGMAYVHESSPYQEEEVYDSLAKNMEDFICGRLAYTDACQACERLIDTRRPIERVNAILGVDSAPLPPSPDTYFSGTSIGVGSLHCTRKRARPWTENEDQRLLAAIHRYGLDDWTSVTAFVGSSRTRPQCSQRWFRGLDPRISKILWTAQEEAKLSQLVAKYGEKSWSKIASEMANRSDAQCRYHYRQMSKSKQTESGSQEFQISNVNSMPPQQMQLASMSIPYIQSAVAVGTARKKLPSISEMMGRDPQNLLVRQIV